MLLVEIRVSSPLYLLARTSMRESLLSPLQKGPLCKTHRFGGRRECTSCVFDLKQRGREPAQQAEHQSLPGSCSSYFSVCDILCAARRGFLNCRLLKENIVSNNLV
jgi:hypothetical protein